MPLSITAIPTPVPSVSLLAPVSLTSVSPLKLKRGLNALLDVRGANLGPDNQIMVLKLKGKGDPGDIQVVRKKLSDSTLLQVLVNVAANAPTGTYALTVSDAQGRASNALTVEVIP